MYVCLCKAVDDEAVRRAVEAGAQSFQEIARLCRAGSGCGGCRDTIETLLRQMLARDAMSGERYGCAEAST